MLNSNEFKSIWEIAHRWERLDPDSTDPHNLPDGVIHKIESIAWAFFRRIFPLRHSSGRKVLDDQDLLSLLIFNWSRNCGCWNELTNVPALADQSADSDHAACCFPAP